MARQPQSIGPGEACQAPTEPVWKEGKFSYPKVMIKSISSVLESCYNMKEWVERRKRKQLVKWELHNIDPSLGLINIDGELIYKKWKAFKRARNIMSMSMNVLLERPGETYFAKAKQLKSKNKTCDRYLLLQRSSSRSS